MSNKRLRPNIVRGGVAIPIPNKNNYYYMKGRKHDNTGFTAVEDMNHMTDEELYTEILRQYKDWLNTK